MRAELLSLVFAAFVVALPLLALRRSWQRERALALVARGRSDERGDLRGVAARLRDPEHRGRLRTAMEDALGQADHWEELPAAMRPPETVRNLTAFRGEVEEIVSLLRSSDASPQALALLELLIAGGYASTLYAGNPEEIRPQLWRIRYLLQTGDHDAAVA